MKPLSRISRFTLVAPGFLPPARHARRPNGVSPGLMAVKELADEHRAQVQNYLRATGFQLGLLVNFGHYPKVEIERIVNTRGRYSGTVNR